MLIDGLSVALPNLRQLRDAGLHISIDDFGTGYSSFSSMCDLPIGEIKIDRSFVTRMARGSEGEEVVRAIIAMGRAMGKRIVAEGIETELQYRKLLELGCDGGQGYLFARPLAPSRRRGHSQAGASAGGRVVAHRFSTPSGGCHRDWHITCIGEAHPDASDVEVTMTSLSTVHPAAYNYAKAPRASAREEAAARYVKDLVGLVNGVLADGRIGDNEAHFLRDWIEQHATARAAWPACVLYPRLLAAMINGRSSYEEELELLSLLAHTMRGVAALKRRTRTSSALPFCNPQPALMFEGRRFCFVGAFYSGTRAWCEQQVVTRGGTCAAVSEKLDYLVIGTIGARDWTQSEHGQDIAKAASIRDKGVPLAIVGEKHWHQYLAGMSRQ